MDSVAQRTESWWTAPVVQHSREAFDAAVVEQLPRMSCDKRADQLVGQVRADSFSPAYESRKRGGRTVFPGCTSGWTAR